MLGLPASCLQTFPPLPPPPIAGSPPHCLQPALASPTALAVLQMLILNILAAVDLGIYIFHLSSNKQCRAVWRKWMEERPHRAVPVGLGTCRLRFSSVRSPA